MSTLLRSAVIAGALAAPVVSQAATPTLGDVFKASGISESGYIDAGYSYNNRQFAAPGVFSYGGVTTGTGNSFTLNQVGLTLSSTPSSGFGGVVDVLGGKDAGGLTTGGGDVVLKQAYAQYTTGALTVMGGRFVTLAGSEVIASTGNSNATRSLLFGIQPLTHTGVRAAFKAGSLTFTGGLNNSYNGDTQDGNPQKTVELQGAFASDTVSVALTGYKGTENQTVNGVVGAGSPSLVDLVASVSLTKAVSLGLNFDHFAADDALKTKADGLALYGNLQATDALRFGVRGEYLKAKDNTGDLSKPKEVTLTGAVAAASNFDIVTDVRWDKDSLAQPFGSAAELAAVPPAGHDSMITLVVKGIYKF